MLRHPADDPVAERHAVAFRHGGGGPAGRARPGAPRGRPASPGRRTRCSSRTSAARSARSRPAARPRRACWPRSPRRPARSASWPARRSSACRASALVTATAARRPSVPSVVRSSSSQSVVDSTTTRPPSVLPPRGQGHHDRAPPVLRLPQTHARRGGPGQVGGQGRSREGGRVAQQLERARALAPGDVHVLVAVEQDDHRLAAGEPRGGTRDRPEDLGQLAVLDDRLVDLPERLHLGQVAARALHEARVVDGRPQHAPDRGQQLDLVLRERPDGVAAHGHHPHRPAARVERHEHDRAQAALTRGVARVDAGRDVGHHHRAHGVERAADGALAAAEAGDGLRVVRRQAEVMVGRAQLARASSRR